MTMMRWRYLTLLAAAAQVAALGACTSVPKTRFVNPDFNFGFVERVAVLPLENLSTDRQAGARATRLIITELLASGAVDVVEPGEVQAALNRLGGTGGPPSTEQVLSLGQQLDVQAIIVGSVNEAEVVRSGNVTIPVVTLDVHMIETETGAAVWATTHTEKGSTLGAKLLGTSGEPMAETMRRAVREVVQALVG